MGKSDKMQGMRVVLTGASAGIGREVARRLAQRGARLVLAARTEDALKEVEEECRRTGGEAVSVRADVGEREDCERLVQTAVDAFGGIDILINNAGISMWARFDEVTDLSIFEKIMRVNYLGTVYCTHYALPHLKASKGLLVGVSSLAGKTGIPTRTAYSASKHAMQGFLDSLRVELRGSGVDVLVASPGFVATDIRARAFGPDGQPLRESPRKESRETMSVEECARQLVRAIERRDRELVMTAQGKAGLWLKLVSPSLVDRIASRALREKGQ